MGSPAWSQKWRPTSEKRALGLDPKTQTSQPGESSRFHGSVLSRQRCSGVVAGYGSIDQVDELGSAFGVGRLRRASLGSVKGRKRGLRMMIRAQGLNKGEDNESNYGGVAEAEGKAQRTEPEEKVRSCPNG